MTNKQALFIIWNAILNQSQNAQKTINSTLVLMERLGLINNFTTSFEKINPNLLGGELRCSNEQNAKHFTGRGPLSYSMLYPFYKS